MATAASCPTAGRKVTDYWPHFLSSPGHLPVNNDASNIMPRMGMYASIRGWLEIDFEQRVNAEQIIQQNRHELYSGGWAFPPAPFNWSLYLFYGGDIRQGEISWLRNQVDQLAGMSPVDEDNDWPRGLFVVTAEDRADAQMWQVREGTVTELPAPGMSWLAE